MNFVINLSDLFLTFSSEVISGLPRSCPPSENLDVSQGTSKWVFSSTSMMNDLGNEQQPPQAAAASNGAQPLQQVAIVYLPPK